MDIIYLHIFYVYKFININFFWAESVNGTHKEQPTSSGAKSDTNESGIVIQLGLSATGIHYILKEFL